jgi:branched-chain amino acid aminotransferase
MVEKVEKIWMNGELVPWDAAQVHVLTHTLHYGLGVFEGIRCYKRNDGKSAVFRLQEHIERLFESAKTADIVVPFSQAQLEAACLDTIRANKLAECYVRPLAYVAAGSMGIYVRDNPIHVIVATWRWGAYLGDEGMAKGIRAKVSSFSRPGVNIAMTKAKIVGGYVNSILAKREVVASGYDEAIMLDPQGYVAEASGENIFVVRRGRVFTPPSGASVLAGITRDAVLTLCKELGISAEERMVSRDELYNADEVFFTGTAAEITPVREVDNRKVGSGSRGPITQRIQERFFQIVRGGAAEPSHAEWLSYV